MRELLRTKSFSVEEIFPIIRGRKTKFNAVIKNDVSVILPVLPDKRILMERQMRYVVSKHIYELPAGTVEKGEPPIRTAARELEEETGYRAKKLKFMFKGYSSPGVLNEMLHFYMATGLYKGKMKRDADEMISLKPVTLNDALRMIKDGRIIDVKTVAGILHYHEMNTRLL